MLAWARERSGRDDDYLQNNFPRLPEWESGTIAPTLNQLEKFARATYTPFGFFFLKNPPEMALPIQDFRTVGSTRIDQPSPDLLDTIAICEARQDWYRAYLIERGEEPLEFVGSLHAEMNIADAAISMRETLDFTLEVRAKMGTWEEALRTLVARAESAGVLVMINGVVGSNTYRKLDLTEFRGFALADAYAPVVFINGSDAKGAQIFTLAHELVHIWLGQSAVGNSDIGRSELATIPAMERWCNGVAGELLVPGASLQAGFRSDSSLNDEVQRLARQYKVSGQVVARRLYDETMIGWSAYQAALESMTSSAHTQQASGRGNFYNTAPVRASKRFTRAVIASTLEGSTLYRDAFRLLGFKSQSAFDGLSHELGLS